MKTNHARAGVSFYRTLFSILPLLISIPSHGSPIPEPASQYWVTDGPVNAIAKYNGVLYMGGDFHYVGPVTGGAVLLNATSGVRSNGFPKVSGTVNVIIPDGSGGWYLGGNFGKIGGQVRYCLAHVLSDFSVDPTIAVDVLGDVTGLVLVGHTLYVSGNFPIIGGQFRTCLAAIDVTTGLVQAWDPALNGPPARSVNAIAVSGNTLYIGGLFNSVGGQSRTNIAALDLTTGLATSWNPGANGRVHALLVAANTVYAGGAFTTIGGAARRNVAALDKTTGSATVWADDNANGTVFSLALSGSTLYVGGTFTRIGGATTRHALAALDASSGAATPWDPGISSVVGNPAAGGIVYSLVVANGSIYVGGYFKVCGGQNRFYLAALDPATGLATSWNPGADFTARALAVSGNTVLAGGEFTSVGGVHRSNLAALDIVTGAATSWSPTTEYYGTVNALAVTNDLVYVGGRFTNILGQIRRGIGAINRTDGTVNPWNPAPGGNPSVQSLLLSGGLLYAGGSFYNIGGQNRTNLVALDTTTALATSWSPNPNSAGTVNAMALSGNLLYVGGRFTSIGGQSRNYLAALDSATGVAASWNPAPNNQVNSLAVDGARIYAGGTFTSVGGLPRGGIAAWNSGTGNVITNWDSDLQLSSSGIRDVQSIAPAGSSIYIAGNFSYGPGVGGTYTVSELDTTTGATTPWFSYDRSDVYVPLGIQTGKALIADSDRLYLAGQIPANLMVYPMAIPPAPPHLESPHLDPDAFRAQLIGQDGQNYYIEATSDFQFWQPFGPFQTSGGTYNFEDTNAAFFDVRFYRAYAAP
ncbi:MAG TPA: hypothetical protein VFZ59_03960 [Verrucomicrobiae bacterium]|nr:hypothetical protein [Verrucomicrobiae bacterium]